MNRSGEASLSRSGTKVTINGFDQLEASRRRLHLLSGLEAVVASEALLSVGALGKAGTLGKAWTESLKNCSPRWGAKM
jgi:hypothetical protein